MPRRIDPSNINVGKGRVPQGTVADNSLRQPNRDIDPLRVHVHDPSRAHMASSIGIADKGECFTSDEVEGALQEICSGAAAGRLNGLVEGGRFDEVIAGLPSAGLVLTLESAAAGNNDTVVLVGAGALDVSGLTVTLLDNATQYIYLDTNSANPTYLQLVSSISLPEVETAAGIEVILFAEVTTLAGNVTAYTDARFFVRNLDRKVTYSSRQGENVDAWSQGCFATLEAFIFWMENYGSTTGTGEEEKGTVFIRGAHTLQSTLVINTAYLEFKADGRARIQPSPGFTGSALIDFSTGGGDITFDGIEFVNGVAAGLIALRAVGGFKFSNVHVRNCIFSPAGTDFGTCLDFRSNGTGFGLWVKNNTMYASDVGAVFEGIRDVHLEDNRIIGPSATAPGTNGVRLGVSSQISRQVEISGNLIERFEVGLRSDYTETLSVEGNRFEDCKHGLVSSSGTLGASSPSCKDFSIRGNTFDLGGDGEGGILLREVPIVTIDGNRMMTDKVSFGGATPVGVWVNATATTVGLKDVPLDTVVANNVISGFLDRNTGNGAAVFVLGDGAGGNPAANVSVSDNQMEESGVSFRDLVHGFHVTGNTLTGYLDETPAVQLNAPVAIQVLPSAVGVASRGIISDNRIMRFGEGIHVLGASDTLFSRNIEVTGNQIVEGFRTQDNQTDTFDGIGCKGIGLLYCQDVTVTGNEIREHGKATTNGGVTITPQANVYCVGIYSRNSRDLTVANNTVAEIQSFAFGYTTGIYFSFNAVVGATLTKYRNFNVTGNVVLPGDANADMRAGILFNTPDGFGVGNAMVNGNRVEFIDALNPAIHGIRFSAQVLTSLAHVGGAYSDFAVESNRIYSCTGNGIDFDLRSAGGQAYVTSLLRITISNNTILLTKVGTVNHSIQVFAEGENFNSFLHRLSITDNKLYESGDFGIRVLSQDSGAPVVQMREVNIDGNELESCRSGIEVIRSGVNDDEDQGLSVSRNRVGSLSLPTTTESALRILFGAASFERVIVDGNEFQSLEDLYGAAVTIGADGAGTTKVLRNISFSDNQVVTDLDDTDGNQGVSIQTTDFQFFNLRVDNNRVAGGSDTVGNLFKPSFEILCSATVSFPFFLSSTTVSGNLLSGGPLRLEVTDVSLTGITISNNTVSSPTFAANGSTFGCIDLKGTYTGLYLPGLGLLDVAVDGNKTLGGSKGIAWEFVDFLNMVGVSISDNQISAPRTGNILPAGYGIHLTSNTGTNTYRDFKVDRNQIVGCEEGRHVNIDLGSVTNVSRFSVSDNQLNGPSDPAEAVLLFRTAAVGDGSELTDITVDGNTIGPSAAGVYPIRGIHFVGPADTTAGYSYTVANISISNNDVNCEYGTAESGYGIYAELKEVDGEAYSTQNLRVDRNSVLCRCTDAPSDVGGILVNLTCSVRNLTVNDNTVRGSVADALMGNAGIKVYHEFTVLQGRETSSGSDAYVVGVAATGPAFPLIIDGVDWSAVSWQNINISNNDVFWKAGWGSPSPTPNPMDAAITIDHNRETNPPPFLSVKRVIVPTWGCVINGNSMQSGKINIYGTQATRGFAMRTSQDSGQWPGGSPALSGTDYWQRGWAISGNSATDFRFNDTSTGLQYGQCVNELGPIVGPPSNGIVSGNVAADSDAAGLTGWDSLSLVSGSNTNEGSRPF